MSYFEQIIELLQEIKTETKNKKMFIEIIDKYKKRRFINVDFIEEIAEIDEERSYIYLGFNSPNAIEQDYFEVNIPYTELVSMIRKGGKKC